MQMNSLLTLCKYCFSHTFYFDNKYITLATHYETIVVIVWFAVVVVVVCVFVSIASLEMSFASIEDAERTFGISLLALVELAKLAAPVAKHFGLDVLLQQAFLVVGTRYSARQVELEMGTCY